MFALHLESSVMLERGSQSGGKGTREKSWLALSLSEATAEGRRETGEGWRDIPWKRKEARAVAKRLGR